MENLIQKYLQNSALKNLCSTEDLEKVEFSPVPKGNEGDLAISFFQLTKILKKSPVELGQIFKEVLEKADFIEKIEMAGPYLNVFFHLEKFFEKIFETPLTLNLLQGKKIMVEFSSPNTNKPLHLGHMRNHALGLSVCALLKKAGGEVIQTVIFNDRGVHICKSMLAYQQFGNGESPEKTGKKSDHFVGDYYVKFDSESKKDPDLNDQVQKMLVDWEQGDPSVKKLWKQMNEWAFRGYEKTYARQGITFDKKYYESELYQTGKKLVLDSLAKNPDSKVLQKKPDGAIFMDLEKEGLGEKILLRANGTTIYMTQDLATTQVKQKDFQPDEQIWVVADEQNYHFQVLFQCLEKLEILEASHLFHLSYGLVNLPEGRMKSREGTVVDADDLMDELHQLVAQKIESSPTGNDISQEERETIAEQVQNAAWKFYLLRTAPNKSITFEPEKSIDFHGDTGAYLQYAGVRLKSILNKAQTGGLFEKDSDLLEKSLIDQKKSAFTPEEKAIGVKILEYPKVLARAVETRNPTFMATYLIELTRVWSRFYAENSVLNTETEDLKIARLILVKKVLDILTSGLEGLSIEIPERM